MNKPYFPIYRSTNGGQTWTEISRVQVSWQMNLLENRADRQDTVNNWGLRYQPQLYVLPQAMGGFAAGTVLLAGNSIPGDLSKTKLDLYASTDNG